MLRILCLAFAAGAGIASAQIHADFSVSQGTASLGTFRVRLDYDKAPRTCANFIGLATGQRPWVDEATGAVKTGTPYYNGLTFHRLIHDFMIQGGSPNGLGTDGPGYVIQDEFDGTLRHSGRYILSMAKASLPNTGGSQFFITFDATSFLDDKHSVFGEVISGREIIDNFTNPTGFPTDRSIAGASPGDPNYADRPITPIVINSITIGGDGLGAFDINAQSLMLPHVRPLTVTPSRNSAASSMSLTFRREAQHNYIINLSPDLRSWTPFREVLSVSAANPWSFTISGLPFDKFFARVANVDYSALPNPSNVMGAAGATLVFSDRNDNRIELVSNGSGEGTWNDSSGASGNILYLENYDFVGSSGAFSTSDSNAHRFPLAQVYVELDGVTNPDARNTYNLVLSFHSATGGWIEGTASGGGNPFTSTVLRQFTYTP